MFFSNFVSKGKALESILSLKTLKSDRKCGTLIMIQYGRHKMSLFMVTDIFNHFFVCDCLTNTYNMI